MLNKKNKKHLNKSKALTDVTSLKLTEEMFE